MGTQRLEKFLASGIYSLLGISAGYFFSVGLANGIASGYHYPIRQKLLIGAALIGAATLLLSAILGSLPSGCGIRCCNCRHAADVAGLLAFRSGLYSRGYDSSIVVVCRLHQPFRVVAAFSGYSHEPSAATQVRPQLTKNPHIAHLPLNMQNPPLVKMQECKLSARQRVVSRACVVLPTPGIVG